MTMPAPMPHYTTEELMAHEAAIAADELRDLPTAADIVALLQLVLDPETNAEERAAAVADLAENGRVSSRTFDEAHVLSDNDGLVLRIGAHRFFITVV
jgi:hypothetical protein